MNSTKIVFILSLLMIISANGQSQSTYRSCYGFDCKEKKWSFSIFAGFSLLGPGNDLTHGMKDSGFGDPARGKPIQYPISKTGIVWNVEAMYNLSKVSGLQLTIGKTLHSSVEGLDRIGLGNYLRIRNDLCEERNQNQACDDIFKLRYQQEYDDDNRQDFKKCIASGNKTGALNDRSPGK